MAAAPRPEYGARRSLLARLAAGPLARRVALVDLRVYRLLRRDLQVPVVEAHVRRFSSLGEHGGCWLALGAVGALVDVHRRDRWGRAARAVLVAYLANTALKAIFNRKRPALDDLPALIATPTKLSFPSAHSSSSFAAACAYSPLLPPSARTGLYAAAAAMALSRVYLGVHYPSDIVAGALLGTAVGSAAR